MVRVSVPHTLIGMECKAILDSSHTCQKLQHLPRAMDTLKSWMSSLKLNPCAVAEMSVGIRVMFV